MVPNCGPEANPPLKCVDWIIFSAIDFFINFFSSPVIWFNFGSAVIPESLGVNIDNLQQHLRVKHLQQIKSFFSRSHFETFSGVKQGQKKVIRHFRDHSRWYFELAESGFSLRNYLEWGIIIENMYVYDYYNLEGCDFEWVNFYINTSKCKQFACFQQLLVSVIGK